MKSKVEKRDIQDIMNNEIVDRARDHINQNEY